MVELNFAEEEHWRTQRYCSHNAEI